MQSSPRWILARDPCDTILVRIISLRFGGFLTPTQAADFAGYFVL